MPNPGLLQALLCDHIILERQTCGAVLVILRIGPAAHALEVSVGREIRCSFELISNMVQAGTCVSQVEVLLRFRRVSGRITDQSLTQTWIYGMGKFQSVASCVCEWAYMDHGIIDHMLVRSQIRTFDRVGADY